MPCSCVCPSPAFVTLKAFAACNKPGPVGKVFEEDGIEVDALFVLLFVVRVLFFYHNVCCIFFGFFKENVYRRMLTSRLAMDTRMEVAEMTVVVVLPMSEFFALVLLGVTYRMSFCCR